MAPIAVLLLAGLIGYGPTLFGWSDTNQYIRIALVAAFVFGAMFGWGFSRQK